MKTEVLEALLLDRALGQLTPEVEALLAEYVATHPQATDALPNWDETVSLAATVLKKQPPALKLPPSPVVVFPRSRLRSLAALAASFAAGAGLAVLGLRSGPSPTVNPIPHQSSLTVPAPIAAPVVRQTEVPPAIRTLPFWSTERAIALATTKRTNTHNIP